MITAKWRKGTKVRILDIMGRKGQCICTLAFDPEAICSTSCPYIFIFTQSGNKMRKVRVPHIPWRIGYKYRKFGGLVAYRLVSRLIYRTFSNAHNWYNKP